jgi:hypothetical protein
MALNVSYFSYASELALISKNRLADDKISENIPLTGVTLFS